MTEAKAAVAIAIVYAVLALTGCGTSDATLRILDERIAGFEMRLANGERLSDAAKAELATALADARAERERIRTQIEEGSGISPAGSSALTGGVFLLLGLVQRAFGLGKKLKDTRRDLYGKLGSLEAKSGAG